MRTLLQIIIWVIDLLAPTCPPDMAVVGLTCVDRYEAPNLPGVKPLVMQSAEDAEAWCVARGRRLCTEAEWEWACYQASEPCNNDKQWMPWDRKTANTPSEVKRLWQGSPSGAYPECRTPSGIYDLLGNVEEWVISKPGRDWPYGLKGGWWAFKFPGLGPEPKGTNAPNNRSRACRRVNDAHEPTFRFYQTGFRCCSGFGAHFAMALLYSAERPYK